MASPIQQQSNSQFIFGERNLPQPDSNTEGTKPPVEGGVKSADIETIENKPGRWERFTKMLSDLGIWLQNNISSISCCTSRRKSNIQLNEIIVSPNPTSSTEQPLVGTTLPQQSQEAENSRRNLKYNAKDPKPSLFSRIGNKIFGNCFGNSGANDTKKIEEYGVSEDSKKFSYA
jgi:hypothetical protein